MRVYSLSLVGCNARGTVCSYVCGKEKICWCGGRTGVLERPELGGGASEQTGKCGVLGPV